MDNKRIISYFVIFVCSITINIVPIFSYAQIYKPAAHFTDSSLKLKSNQSYGTAFNHRTFNVESAGDNLGISVDARTGQFSYSIPLTSVVYDTALGKSYSIKLTFNSNQNHQGVGYFGLPAGWSLSLPVGVAVDYPNFADPNIDINNPGTTQNFARQIVFNAFGYTAYDIANISNNYYSKFYGIGIGRFFSMSKTTTANGDAALGSLHHQIDGQPLTNALGVALSESDQSYTMTTADGNSVTWSVSASGKQHVLYPDNMVHSYDANDAYGSENAFVNSDIYYYPTSMTLNGSYQLRFSYDKKQRLTGVYNNDNNIAYLKISYQSNEIIFSTPNTEGKYINTIMKTKTYAKISNDFLVDNCIGEAMSCNMPNGNQLSAMTVATSVSFPNNSSVDLSYNSTYQTAAWSFGSGSNKRTFMALNAFENVPLINKLTFSSGLTVDLSYIDIMPGDASVIQHPDHILKPGEVYPIASYLGALVPFVSTISYTWGSHSYEINYANDIKGLNYLFPFQNPFFSLPIFTPGVLSTTLLDPRYYYKTSESYQLSGKNVKKVYSFNNFGLYQKQLFVNNQELERQNFNTGNVHSAYNPYGDERNRVAGGIDTCTSYNWWLEDLNSCLNTSDFLLINLPSYKGISYFRVNDSAVVDADQGRLIKTTKTYNQDGMLIKSTGTTGLSTSYSYEPAQSGIANNSLINLVASTVNPLGYVTNYSYTNNAGKYGKVAVMDTLSIHDPKGDVLYKHTLSAYDEFNRPWDAATLNPDNEVEKTSQLSQFSENGAISSSTTNYGNTLSSTKASYTLSPYTGQVLKTQNLDYGGDKERAQNNFLFFMAKYLPISVSYGHSPLP